MIKDLQLIRPGETRVRIAPSPTGKFHIGSARVALFNYIFAKKQQGTFILRIEDTDTKRSRIEFEEDIKKGLKWLGIETQEFYRQSERKEIYKKYIEKLLEEKKIYRCFCSVEDLKAHRDYQMSIGQPPRYSQKCRELSKEEEEKKLKAGLSFVFRLKTSQKDISFFDLLRKKITQSTETFGDIVIAKGIDAPLYNLACVIDDFEMKITHIIRGEDHISNTPKQILIAEALGIVPPKYLHLPLILGGDRTKLSKRHGAVSLLSYKEDGYLPEAMVNFLAFLGWHPEKEREIFSISSLIKEFSIQGVQKSGAIFNIEKLDWLNGFYIRQKSIARLTELCIPYFQQKAGLFIGKGLKIGESQEISAGTVPGRGLSLQKIVKLYQERLKKLSDIYEFTDFFFKEKLEYKKELLIWKDMDDRGVKDSLNKSKKLLSKIKDSDWDTGNIEKTFMEQENRGYLLWPLRVAITGKKASASPFDIAEILGKEKTLLRIKEASKKI